MPASESGQSVIGLDGNDVDVEEERAALLDAPVSRLKRGACSADKLLVASGM
jgi:hypothetical protein